MKRLLTLLFVISFIGACSVTDSNPPVDTAVVSVQGADSFEVQYPGDDGTTSELITQSSRAFEVSPTGQISVISQDAKITIVLLGEGQEVHRQWDNSELTLNY